MCNEYNERVRLYYNNRSLQFIHVLSSFYILKANLAGTSIKRIDKRTDQNYTHICQLLSTPNIQSFHQ